MIRNFKKGRVIKMNRSKEEDMKEKPVQNVNQYRSCQFLLTWKCSLIFITMNSKLNLFIPLS